jgi:hypothetical protein
MDQLCHLHPLRGDVLGRLGILVSDRLAPVQENLLNLFPGAEADLDLGAGPEHRQAVELEGEVDVERDRGLLIEI